MKKLFTLDDFMVAFISALGYGLGAEIPVILGLPAWVSPVLSLIAGMALSVIADKLVFSKLVQKKPANRFLAFGGILLIFVIAQIVLSTQSEVSLLQYVKEEHLTIILFPILGFLFSVFIRWLRIRKIRAQYGDGSKGFVYAVKQADIDAVNRQNQPITGAYDAACAVKTRTGVYVGVKDKKLLSFSGIPYAKPPVGERRWKAPEPLDDSDAVFEAKYAGASAVQVEFEGSILRHHRQSEDCLTLNICVGAEELKTKKKKPVMVLFHHGDFSYGGSADPLMYGDQFSRSHPDLVLVSFNYRLGIFGFIDFSEVPGGEACPDALNLGLLDQIAALRWVQENIAAFGGDPNKVTVVGFESGAISISLLAACEQAKGLFRRAFVFFGSPESAYVTPDASRALARRLMEETSAADMAQLQQLSTERLKEAAQKLWKDMAAPTCDGKLIPLNVAAAYEQGAAAGIDFIIGIPSDERQIYKSFIGSENYEYFIHGSVAAILAYLDQPNAEAVKAYIAAEAGTMPELDAEAKVYEQWSALCMYRSAFKLAAGGNRVHVMIWDVKPLLENLGSGTVDVASAFFGNSETSQLYGNVMDADLSEIMQSFLKKFICGDSLRLYHNEIKGVNELEWKRYPKALIISNDKLVCEPFAERVTEIKSLVEFMQQ